MPDYIEIDGVSPEEYAAYWGSDKGDGYMFYNFSGSDERRDTEFLTDFLEAIDRLMGRLHEGEDRATNEQDLGLLRGYVAELLEESKHPEVPVAHASRFSFRWSDVLGAAIRAKAEAIGEHPYRMSITSKAEIRAIERALAQGIDAHLEACNCPERGDRYERGRRGFTATEDGPIIAPETTPRWKKGEHVTITTALDCLVSAESLPVLVRRLMEDETEDSSSGEGASSLVSGICSTLEIELV